MNNINGPWQLHDKTIVDKNGDAIIEILSGYKQYLNLVACAPELLEELEQIRESLNDSVLGTGSKTMDQEILNSINKLIKKAKGL